MKKSSEIEAVVRRFLAARINLDVEAMRNLHSPSEYGLMIGSAREEWDEGYDTIIHVWESQEGWEVADSTLISIQAFENGDTGWAAVEQERTLVSGQTVVFRITMVLVLEASAWKVVQIHLSIPVPNEDVLGVELTGTLSDLLASIETEFASQAIDGSVGTATILFTDVVGSTAISRSMGDRRWSDLITSHFDAVRHVAERERGTVVKTVGDGGMYVFDSGASALLAAIGIQESVAASAEDELKLRVGVHTGDAIHSQGDFYGSAVNKAARVAAAALGDQILVSSTTVEMVSPAEFEFGDPITAELKGIDGTHLLKPLLWQ